MNYSYVMGVNNIKQLEQEGFSIEKIGNSYGITFNDDKRTNFEEYIIDNLNPGFWNEYLGKEKVFIFKFKNGEVKKYILNNENEKEILELCNKFANFEFESINKMLKDNSFYSKKYFKDNI